MTARGQLTVVADILTVIPGLHMVELHKAAGEAGSFYQYYSALQPLVRVQGSGYSGWVQGITAQMGMPVPCWRWLAVSNARKHLDHAGLWATLPRAVT